MKRMGQLRSILLCGLGGYGAGLSLCALLGFSAEKSLALALAGLWGAVLGALTEKKRPAMAGTLFGAALVGAIILGVWAFRATTSVMVTVIVAGLSAGALMAGGYGYYGPLGWWSAILLALGLWGSGVVGFALPWRWAALAGMVLSLLLTMDGFRENSMRSAQLRDRHSPGMGNPSGILQHSYLLLGIFLAAALVLGLSTMGLGSGLWRGIQTGASGAASGVSQIFAWIEWAIETFLEWIRHFFHAPQDEHPHVSDSAPKGQYPGGDGSWFFTILTIICMVALAVVIAAMVGGLLVRARKKGKPLEEDPDYIDEVEDLERPKHLFRRKNHGKQKISDFDDPVMKIRFVFQQLLRQKSRTDPMTFSRTPNELRDEAVPDEPAVVEAYNRVKYGRGQVSAQDVATAERYLKNL